MLKSFNWWTFFFVLFLLVGSTRASESSSSVSNVSTVSLNPKWIPPDYSHQENALGWTPDVFNVPADMEERVQFWKDIYTKYTSDQGILHDSLYVHLVYDSLDFSDISIRTELTSREKQKMREKYVKEKKREVVDRLKRLEKLKSADGLEGEDLRFWKMFERVDEPHKFSEAMRRGRLRFQLGQRTQFIFGIFQSGRYLRQMEEIFIQEGVPRELTRLPFVESSFNLRARSKVGASGIWQFMRTTARRYLRMDTSVDERNDPLQATRAAAKKMKENYTYLKSWPLAITAYNHGPSGVMRLTEKFDTTDLGELLDVRHGRFGFASANFYASFIAAIEVEKNAEQYFGSLDTLPELRGAEIQLTKYMSVIELLKWFDGDIEQARLLNPHIHEAVWQGKARLSPRNIFRVPLMQEKHARAELE